MFETVCMERIQPFDDPIPPDDEEEVTTIAYYCTDRQSRVTLSNTLFSFWHYRGYYNVYINS